MKKKILSLIITCYNERENIIPMYERIVTTLGKLKQYDFEAIYLDNNSPDGSREVLASLAKKDKRVKVIIMSRNFGSPQPSFVAGLTYASGDAAILLHGDIQDPPEIIPEFLRVFEEGYDSVYGIRTHRKGYGILWNFYYKAFYFILHRISYISIPQDAGEFSIISRRMIDALVALPEFDYNVRCLRALVGFKHTGIPYVREDRRAGESTVNFFNAFISAEEMIINFSFKPLRWIMWSGFGVVGISFILFTFRMMSLIIFGVGISWLDAGYIFLLGISGVQLLSMAILGLYISKIFLEVKGRPRFIIGETMNLPTFVLPIQKRKTLYLHKNDYESRRPDSQGI